MTNQSHNSEWDEKAIAALNRFKDACWDAQYENTDICGMNPRDAYDIFCYLELIMKEKQIIIGDGGYT